jgi:pyrroline-5-carboxylate reductase
MISPGTPLVLVGAGNMGGAMLSGWLDAGTDPAAIMVIDPKPSEAMAERLVNAGVRCEASAPEGVTAGILMLAVKPQIMDAVLPGLKGLVGPKTVSLSVAAGKTISYFEERLGGAVVRTIPNTPAMVGRGITGAVANAAVSSEAKAEIDRLLSVCGPVEWVEDEAMIDAITAVSGSGPAYVFYLVECMAEAGRKCGLPAVSRSPQAGLQAEDRLRPGDRREEVIRPDHRALHAGNAHEPAGDGGGQLSAAPDRAVHVGSADAGVCRWQWRHRAVDRSTSGF